MKYSDLSDAENQDFGTHINKLTIEFEKHFGFGLTITDKEGEGILGTGLTVRENGTSPFWFTLDESNQEIAVEAVLSRRLQFHPTDLLRYQKRYKRRSKKYESFCNTLIRLRELSIQLMNNLDQYTDWFDANNINHTRIVDQIRETQRLISIMLDIKSLHEYKVYE